MSIVQQLNLSQQIYNILKQKITERHLPPNTKLDINALAAEMKVSRTPVVEALTRLATERLVIRRNRVGTFVAPLDHTLFEEIFEARQMIEQWALDKAMTRITSEEIEALRQVLLASAALLVGVTDETFDYLKYTEYDVEFHLRLVQAGNNQRISEFYASLNSHLHIARTYSLRALQRSIEGQLEHEMILNAYASGDRAAAEQAQRAHMQKSHEQVLLLLAEHDYL